jgi:hypothetical protein
MRLPASLAFGSLVIVAAAAPRAAHAQTSWGAPPGAQPSPPAQPAAQPSPAAAQPASPGPPPGPPPPPQTEPPVYGIQPAPPATARPTSPPTEPLPAPMPTPRMYGYTEQEGSGGRPSNLRQAWNTVYVEALGNAGLYSLNYDRLVTENLAFRVGASYASGNIFDRNVGSVTIPVMVSWLAGNYSHKFEVGVGPVACIQTAGGVNLPPFGDNSPIGGTATVGYRYTPLNGGFTVRVGFTPLFGAGGFWPWGGVGAGAMF